MRQLLIIAMVLTFAASASAGLIWSDDFDSYLNGQILDGTPDDGGWKGWDNGAAWGAPVTNAQSQSAPHSVEINASADLVHEFNVVGGTATFTAWQYIPLIEEPNQGITYFILLNRYNDGGPYNWSIQLEFNLDTGTLEDVFTGVVEARAIVYDQWAEIRVDMDLVNDTQNTYYDGVWLSSNVWTRGEATGQLALEAVDLFSQNTTSVYYDNMSLIPEPSVFLLAGLGLLALIRRKK